MGTQRNNYDRFGHFPQGFIPAVIFRELYIRCSPVKGGGWLAWFVFASCLAFGAFFELLEWWATVLSKDSADSFLGYQGDHWDPQWDMLWCAIGAVVSLAVMWYPHNGRPSLTPHCHWGDDAIWENRMRKFGYTPSVFIRCANPPWTTN